MDWALWFYWIMATTTGWLIGNLFFIGIPTVVAGAVISALQWAVLTGRIPKPWRWMIPSILGWVAGYILSVLTSVSNLDIPTGLLIGGSVGLSQWLLLRKEVKWAGWWIVTNILGWMTGLDVLPGLLTSGTLPGALTGLTLVILFRYSNQ